MNSGAVEQPRHARAGDPNRRQAGWIGPGLLGAVLLVAASCASGNPWRKTGASEEQATRDRAECLSEAQAVSPIVIPDPSQTLSAGTPPRPPESAAKSAASDYFDACMQSRGYRWDDDRAEKLSIP